MKKPKSSKAKTVNESNPLEKDIEKAVCKYAVSLGCMQYKFTSPAKRSVPDRVFITPNGVVFFIEFKRLGGRPTLSQYAEMAKLEAQTAPVFIADSVPFGKRCVNIAMAFRLDRAAS